MLLAMLFGSLIGCGGPGFTTEDGFEAAQFFPYDGERTWEFAPCPTSDPDKCVEGSGIAYRIVAENLPEFEVVDGENVYTTLWYTDCVGNDMSCVDGQELRSMRWSSNPRTGVKVHTIDEGSPLNFDPPVVLTPRFLNKGESQVTETNHGTWTSTFVDYEVCPTTMAVVWDQCARIEVSSTGPANALTGVIWANTGYNVVAFEPDAEPGVSWRLSSHDCVDCDGLW